MKGLPPRLSAALDLLKPTVCLADVGTDHGYFPIAAVSSGKARRAIASDNKALPLSKAREHIASSGLASSIDLILADGLAFLDERVGVVSLMGMGGTLIVTILDAARLTGVSQLVLGPNNDHALLRRWLVENGWKIDDERFVADHGHEYQLISAIPGSMRLSEMEEAFGPVILQTKNEAFLRFLARRIEKFRMAQERARDPQKSAELSERIRHLQELIR